MERNISVGLKRQKVYCSWLPVQFGNGCNLKGESLLIKCFLFYIQFGPLSLVVNLLTANRFLNDFIFPGNRNYRLNSPLLSSEGKTPKSQPA